MSHKGSRSRITDHEAAREAWERIWGKREKPEEDKKEEDEPEPHEP